MRTYIELFLTCCESLKIFSWKSPEIYKNFIIYLFLKNIYYHQFLFSPLHLAYQNLLNSVQLIVKYNNFWKSHESFSLNFYRLTKSHRTLIELCGLGGFFFLSLLFLSLSYDRGANASRVLSGFPYPSNF